LEELELSKNIIIQTSYATQIHQEKHTNNTACVINPNENKIRLVTLDVDFCPAKAAPRKTGNREST
jgi:hypothetical protein